MLINNFLSFLKENPTACITAGSIAQILNENGYKAVSGNITSDKFYILKEGAVIAVDISGTKGFSVVAAHSDSPALKLRPNYNLGERYAASVYGGPIYHSWFDKPLGVAGKITVKKENCYYSKAVNNNWPVGILPSLAIHLNRDINEGHKFNPQTELNPLKLKDLQLPLEEGESLLAHELYFYPLTEPALAEDILISPRIDDLACVYPALCAFINSKNKENARVLAIFNSEEIGSNTIEGADSTLLTDTLRAAAEYKGVNYKAMLLSSFMVSADNAHAYHPSYPEKYEPEHRVLMGKGIALKHHENYTTTALSEAVFKDLAKVPCQSFAMRNDMRCGSTLGNISLKHFSVNSVDIGVPMLAMHSAVETCNIKDVEYMYKALSNFYRAEIICENEKVYVK